MKKLSTTKQRSVAGGFLGFLAPAIPFIGHILAGGAAAAPGVAAGGAARRSLIKMAQK